MFRFARKAEAPDSSSTGEGVYIEDAKLKGFMNKKRVYVNKEKNRILAACPISGWGITDLAYYDEIIGKQGEFGALFLGGGDTPAEGSWNDFTVTENKGYIFVVKPGTENYADCDGYYVLDETMGEISGKPVYVNKPKKRFMAAQLKGGWFITSLEVIDEVKKTQGTSKSFHSVDASKHERHWDSYTVTKFGPYDEALYKELAWEKLENRTVSYKSVSFSGALRTEADFLAARKQCMALDCGGFARRKPTLNQYGEEDYPPECFYYRKTQEELRKASSDSTSHDFYIAPEEYTPDTSFKPYRDSAPACHPRWVVDRPVHSFACQVVVPEATAYTYYCVAEFHCGYSGIQQHEGSKKQIIFSVWNDTSATGKVKTVSSRPDITARPFGGEGMGMQAIGVSGDPSASTDCPLAAWKPGSPYTFVVRAFPVTDATEFTCHFYYPDNGWQLLARFSRPDSDEKMRGKLSDLKSFVEDWTRNTLRRSAKYAAWIQYDPKGAWEPVKKIYGTSSVDDDVPNKTVRLSKDSPQLVEVITGGEALEDYSLYDGPLDNPPPVPDILGQLDL